MAGKIYGVDGETYEAVTLPLNVQTSIWGGDKRNFFFAKRTAGIRYCGREGEAIFVMRVK